MLLISQGDEHDLQINTDTDCLKTLNNISKLNLIYKCDDDTAYILLLISLITIFKQFFFLNDSMFLILLVTKNNLQKE